MGNKPTFNPFNPHEKVEVYRRHLPHWRQKGATYFITFRLSDSIPKAVLLQWREQHELWLKAHGITAELSEDEKSKRYAAIPGKERKRVGYNEARCLHIELDRCHGCCLLKTEANAKIIGQAISHFHGERCWVGDYIIMPNHVHLLVQPFDAHPLEEWLQSVKSYTARRFDKQVMEGERVFQQESYDRNHEELEAYRRYIENNGAKAGLNKSEYRHHQCDWL
jgi:putative transposase